jgi:hypothetical protein
MVEQIGDPLRIVGLSRASRHRFALLSVDHQHVSLTLEHVLHGLPGDSRAFSGHMPTCCATREQEARKQEEEGEDKRRDVLEKERKRCLLQRSTQQTASSSREKRDPV